MVQSFVKILYPYKIGEGQGQGVLLGKSILQDSIFVLNSLKLIKNTVSGYKIANFPETLDGISKD